MLRVAWSTLLVVCFGLLVRSWVQACASAARARPRFEEVVVRPPATHLTACLHVKAGCGLGLEGRKGGRRMTEAEKSEGWMDDREGFGRSGGIEGRRGGGIEIESVRVRQLYY